METQLLYATNLGSVVVIWRLTRLWKESPLASPCPAEESVPGRIVCPVRGIFIELLHF